MKIRTEIRHCAYIYAACIFRHSCKNWTPQSDLPKASIPILCMSVWSVRVLTIRGQTWSPVLSLRSQWCPHSLANKWAQSGHPHNGVPPAAGSEGGTCEQLAPRRAADQGRPLPLCRWGQHGKWYVWGGPPPSYWRYLDYGVPGIGCDQMPLPSFYESKDGLL